jgi:15-cis-phytoene synthase
MNLDLEQLKPPKRLAIAYAKQPQRDALTLLLSLDVRLGEILKNSSEPLIAQMRLAWWRDIIGKAPELRPIGEPLIAELNRLQAANPEWDIGNFMLSIIDGWDELLANESWDGDVIVRQATSRSKGIFDGFTAISGHQIASELTGLGCQWAIADLRAYCQNEDQYRAVLSALREEGRNARLRLPRGLRPLTILSIASRDNVSVIRLFWHALTGR